MGRSRSGLVRILAILLGILPAGHSWGASLENVRVAPLDSGAGQWAIYEISFTIPASDSLPADGIIRVIYPPGFDLSFVLVAMAGGSVNGGLRVAVSGDTVEVRRDSTGSRLAGGANVLVRIANVRNAISLGSYSGVVQCLTADSTLIGSGQDAFTVVPGPLHHFTLDGFPDTLTAGLTLGNTITVRAWDAYGNLKTNYAGTVHWSTSDPHAQASVPADAAFDGTTGVKTFPGSSFRLCTAGAQTFTVADIAQGISASSNGIRVKPGAIASFTLSGPATAVAGVPFALSVTGATDGFGNLASGTAVVSLSGGSHAAPDGTMPVLSAISVRDGSGSAQQTLYCAESSVQFQAAIGSVSRSWTVTAVRPGDAFAFELSGYPTAVTAGNSVPVRVTVKDAWGNVKADYTGTVRYGTSDPQGQVPQNYTFSSADGGIHDAVVVLKTAGSQRIWVQELDGSPADTTAGILVEPASISSFTLTAPLTVTAGQAFSLTVSGAVDAYGNAASGTVVVTLTTPGTSPNGTEPQLANIVVTNGSGSAQQVLVRAGSATLKGKVSPSGPERTRDVQVLPGPLASFTLTGIPTSTVAGQSFPGPVTVTAYDAFGNVKTNYTGSVYFESTDAQAQLPYTSSSRYTFAPGDAGSHSFSGSGFVLKTGGSHTVSVTDGTISCSSGPVTVSPGPVASFTLTAGTTQVAGIPFVLTVTAARDAYGNPWSGTVTVRAASGGGQSPNGTSPSLNNVTVTGGSGSASQVLVNAVPTVLEGEAGGVKAATGTIVVQPGAVSSFSVSAPSEVTAGTPFTLTVSNARDAYGNPWAGTVTVAVVSGGGPSPSGSQPVLNPITVAGGAGSGNQVLVNAVQTVLKGQADGVEALTGTIVVRPGPLASLRLTAPPEVVAGSSFPLSVGNAIDAFGNPWSGTVVVQPASGGGNSPNGTPPSLSNIVVTDGSGSANQVLVNAVPTVLEGGVANVKATSGTITVKPAAAAAFALSAPAEVRAGEPFTLSASNAVDPFGNPWSGTITVNVGSGGGPSPNGSSPSLRDIVVQDGSGSASEILVNAVPTVLFGQVGSVQAQTNPITVKPGVFGSLNVAAAPTTAIAGRTFDSPVVVRAYDRYGNLKTDYTGSVYFFCNTDPYATLPYVSSGPYSFTPADTGQHSFPGAGFVLQTPGIHRIGVHEVDTGYEAFTAPIDVTGLQLVSVTTGANQVSRGQTGLEVSLTVRKLGSQAVTALAGGLSFTQAGQDVSSDYTVVRQDTLSVITAAQQGTFVLRFSVSVKAAARLGTVVIGGYVSGKVGSVTVGDNTPEMTASWLVLKPASLTVTSVQVVPDSVSQGDSGIQASLVVTNGDANTAPAVLDQADLLFYGAGGDQTSDFVRKASANNPSQIPGGGSATLNFSLDVSQVARTGPVQVRGRVLGHDLYSGLVTSDTSDAYDALYVRQRPALRIVSILTSQAKVSRSQSAPWEVRVAVENGTSSSQAIDFASTSTFVRFRKAGQDLTSQYSISYPTALASGGSSLAPGAKDSLIFTVNRTGTTTGEITIYARVATVGGAIYTDSELSGKFGSVTVQTPPVLAIQRVVPSQPTVTAGQTAPWAVRVVVANSGQADFRLNPDSTWIRFSTGTDFVVQKPQTWTRSQDLILAGGGTDTLVFHVSATGASAGLSSISARVKGLDVNSSGPVEIATDPTNAGQVLVQTAADLRIPRVVASDTFLTRGTSTNWTVAVTVENQGESAVTVDLDSTFVRFIRSTTRVEDQTYTVLKPSGFSGSGTRVLAGKSSDQLVFTVTKTGTALGTIVLKSSLRAVENNSGRVLRVTESDSDRVVVQTPASVIALGGSLFPAEVNRGSNARFSVRVHNGGGSTVLLNPLQTYIRLSDGVRTYQAALDSAMVRTIAPGDTTLTFLSQPVPANMSVGKYAPQVVLIGTENRNAFSKTLTLTDSVRVNEAASLAIESVRPSQAAVTAGQTREWRIAMLVTNNGGSAVSLDSARLHFYRLSQNVDNKITYTRPTGFAGSGTRLLAGGKTDSLIFRVTQVDPTIPVGNIRIQGTVFVTDVNDTSRHIQQTTDGNSGYVVVQSPAVLSIVRVRPRQPSVTVGQTEDWSVSVWLQNSGESAVQVDSTGLATYLTFGLGTGWQVKAPSRFSNGTWVLAGNRMDSLTFVVDRSASNVTGLCTIDAQVRAIEVNSGREIVVLSGISSRGTILLETPAMLRIDTVLVSTATAPNAPRLNTEQPYLLRIRVLNEGEDEADSVTVRVRSVEGFSLLQGPISAGTVAGKSAVWVEAQGRTGTRADTTEHLTVAITKAMARNTRAPATILAAVDPGDTTYALHVERPAQLAVDSVWTDRDTVLAKQTSPYWHVYVAVRDTGSGPVRIANPTPSDLQFRIGTQVQTGYVVVPQTLSEAERTLDPRAGRRYATLAYEIRQTGATGGLVGIHASVAGVDLNQPTRQPPPSAVGSGQVYVASLAAVQITHTEPVSRRIDSQGRVVVNTGQEFSVRVEVANRGGEDILGLTVYLEASGGSSVGPPQTIDTLAVGKSRTLEFAVTAAGQENPSGEVLRARVTGGRGRESGLAPEVFPPLDDVAAVVIQTPAEVRVRWVQNRAPNTPFVDTGQAFPVHLMVENLGTEPADSVTVVVQGEPESGLEDQTYTVTFPAAILGHDSSATALTVKAGGDTGGVTLRARIARAVGINSGAPAQVAPAVSDSSWAIVQLPASLAILDVWADPDTVIAESRLEWRIYAVVADTGQAPLTLVPGSSDVRVIVGGEDETAKYSVIPPSRLRGRNTLTLYGGEFDTLVYRVTETGPRGGRGELRVQIRAYDRNLGPQSTSLVAVGTAPFFVQTNAVVRIRRTEVLAPHLSEQGWGIVNTGQSFQVRVTVEERQGREGVDSVVVRLSSPSGGSLVSTPVGSIPYIPPAGIGSVVFDVVASSVENLQGEVLQAEVLFARAHESRIPALIESPADPANARAMVRVEKPARLALEAKTVSRDTLLTVGELFSVEILVRNLGTAGVLGVGRLGVWPPPGYAVENPFGELEEEPTEWPFLVGEKLTLRFKAPTEPSLLDTIVLAFTAVPLDGNSNEPCRVERDSAWVIVSTLNPFIRVTKTEITAPQGARDGVLSTGQDFFLRTDIVCSSDLNARRVALRLPPGRGYVVVGDTSRTFSADSVSLYWYLKAPGSADLEPQRIVVYAEGTDGTGSKQIDSDTLRIQSIPRATLSLQVSIVSPPGATDGVLTQGQPFLLQAKVGNGGLAAAVGKGRLRLDLGKTAAQLARAGQDSLSRTFFMTREAQNQTVSWLLLAPETPRTPEVLTVYFEERPNDENTDAPANVAHLSQDFTIETVEGGHVRVDSVFLAAPEGARDGVLSTGQNFAVTAVVTAERVGGQVDAFIHFSSPSYFTSSSLSKLAPGRGVSTSWQVLAPDRAGTVPDTIWVTAVAHDANNDTLTLWSVSRPLLVQVQEQARLLLRPMIVGPEGAKDGVLSTGQLFTVKAQIENRGSAGLVQGDSFRVRIQLPVGAGYRLAAGESEVKASTSPELSWVLEAPAQATLATHNIEFILEDRPRDENSYQKAAVLRDRDVVSVATLQRAKVQLSASITDPPGARDGTVWKGQVFTVSAWLDNLGDAGWFAADTIHMVLTAPQGFQILGDSVGGTLSGRVEWRVRAPEVTGQQFTLRLRLVDTPLDENSHTPVQVLRDRVSIGVSVQAKMLLLSSLPVEKTNTVASGQAGVPLLRLRMENRGEAGGDPILVRGLAVRFTDRQGNEIAPNEVASRVWVASSKDPSRAIAQSTSISGTNPVLVSFRDGSGDTLVGGTSREYILYVDVRPDGRVSDFQIRMAGVGDLDVVDAESGAPVVVGDRNGNPLQTLGLTSDFSVVVAADLKKSFSCYPNPFGYGTRRHATIAYYLKQNTSVDIAIYTLAGELVWSRHFDASSPQARPGMHDGDVTWDGRNGQGMAVLNGVYIVRIVTGTGESAMTKIAVVR